MEPAVPFAALGATALLAGAAWAALAAAALALRGPRTSSLLLTVGCLLLAGIEVATAVAFGEAASDRLALLRATGGLLLTAGLALGALGPRPAAAVLGAPAAGVLVPLGAAPTESVLAGLSLLAASAVALRVRRDRPGVLVALGLLLAAAAAGAAVLADEPRGALAVVALRAVAALALLAGLVLAAQASLLAKLVTTTVAGVLAMAVAALAVVGTVVVRSFEVQSAELVTETAQARSQALRELVPPLVLSTQQLEAVCRGVSPGSDGLARCAFALRLVARDRPAFAVRLPVEGGTGTPVAREGGDLRPLELGGLRDQPLVRDVLEGGTREAQAGLVRLSASGRLAALGAAPSADRGSVLVHGVLLDDRVLAGGLTGDGEDAVALLSGSPLEVTARDGLDEAQVLAVRDRARALLADPRDAGDGRTVSAVGTSPTLRLEPLRERDVVLGYLAVTRSAEVALGSQRRALTLLLLSAVVTTGLVALAALLLGRRTVDPVRRLTSAAQRLAAGDLRAGSGASRSRDEVGLLARTFDTMTTSLSTLTGDLRSSAARLETVLASMSDGLLATDADGRVTAVNRAALAMLGAQDADVVGRRLEDVADVRGPDDAALADPGLRVQDAPGEVHRADGTTVPVRVSVTGLRGADEGDGAVVVLRDTTREREVERMKTEFLSNVSHELRTPLTPIRGYAEILVGRPGLDGDKVGRFAGTILSEALKMGRVVDLLVDVASLEAGRVVPKPVDVDVRELLDARLEAWRAKAPERATDLRRRVAAGLPGVHVDPEWLGKVLDELLDNALKFTPAGTPVTLAASSAPDGRRVRVAVRDAGPGIAEDDQALLFTSFEQVDGSATRRVGGLGLGLSFVRRVAEDAGFPLSVASTVGKGTEFALDLPAAATLPRPRRVSPASRAARR